MPSFKCLGAAFAVKLISNRQPIYYCGSLFSQVSGALSVFKMTLAALLAPASHGRSRRFLIHEYTIVPRYSSMHVC